MHIFKICVIFLSFYTYLLLMYKNCDNLYIWRYKYRTRRLPRTELKNSITGGTIYTPPQNGTGFYIF